MFGRGLHDEYGRISHNVAAISSQLLKLPREKSLWHRECALCIHAETFSTLIFSNQFTCMLSFKAAKQCSLVYKSTAT